MERIRLIALMISLVTSIPLSGRVAAEPFIPEDDHQVLEKLPQAFTSDPRIRELRGLRAELSRTPDDLQLAVHLAWSYIELGQAEADPRYYGYVQAILKPWWQQPAPPAEVLLLRASVSQARHEFNAALADLNRVLKRQPGNAQAWLKRAVNLRVRGDYRQALQSCMPLLRLVDALTTRACIAASAGLNGRATESYHMLSRALAESAESAPQTRRWVLTILAELAARLGDYQAAEQHFEAALALDQRDVYLLSAYADFLLDHDQAEAVVELLQHETRADDLLLRLALAEQRLGLPQLEQHVEQLKSRLDAVQQRGGVAHLGTSARFTLQLLNQPTEALQLALANWALQREPQDTRLVLAAALAANDHKAAIPALDWLNSTKLQDVRIAMLAERLKV